MNLLSNDVVSYEVLSFYFPCLWTGPFLVLSSVVTMFFYIGPCAFTVIGILVLFIPIQREIIHMIRYI